MAKILITGGTGTIGKALCKRLLNEGHEPYVLSRSEKTSQGIRFILWNPDAGLLNFDQIKDISHLVHLAGAGIMDKRWTIDYKHQILESRVKGVKLLHEIFLANGKMPEVVVGASAVGYYGLKPNQNPHVETSPPANDFLGKVCVEWEKSYLPFQKSGSRLSTLRFGIILSSQGGAYLPLAKLCKFGLASATGKGNQAFPWIHVDDVVGIIMRQLFHESVSGPYNVVAPDKVDNKRFMTELAKSLGKSLWLPSIPELMLKLILGERAETITQGAYVSSEKIVNAGYQFKFPQLSAALAALALHK